MQMCKAKRTRFSCSWTVFLYMFYGLLSMSGNMLLDCSPKFNTSHQVEFFCFEQCLSANHIYNCLNLVSKQHQVRANANSSKPSTICTHQKPQRTMHPEDTVADLFPVSDKVLERQSWRHVDLLAAQNRGRPCPGFSLTYGSEFTAYGNSWI